MRKQEKYQFNYKTADGADKVCYPRSKEQIAANRQRCRELGFTVLSVKKLYPYSMEKNQHNFELIANRCFNIMADMDAGEIPYDAAEYDRLYEMREKAQRFFCYGGGIAWVPWEDLKEMRELAASAVEIRVQTCVRTGRLDLIKYC